MQHEWESGGMDKGFCGKARKNHCKDPYISRRIILKWMLEKTDGVLWTGFIRLGMRTSGRLL
jgi:hypothetical protein